MSLCRSLLIGSSVLGLVACLEGLPGFPQHYIPVGGECLGEVGCREGAVCEYGVCRWPCEVDEDCGVRGGCVAVQGEELLGYDWTTRVCLLDEELDCVEDRPDCPEGLYCHVESGQCREGCSEELPCPRGYDCVADTCVPVAD